MRAVLLYLRTCVTALLLEEERFASFSGLSYLVALVSALSGRSIVTTWRRYLFDDMAGEVGLEPTTLCLTDRRSNQLSYTPILDDLEVIRII